MAATTPITEDGTLSGDSASSAASREPSHLPSARHRPVMLSLEAGNPFQVAQASVLLGS
jgi:hypothetical protein